MNWEAWFCFGTLVVLLFALARNRIPTDAVMIVALTIIVAVGAISQSPNLPDAAQAVAGLGNPSLISIVVLSTGDAFEHPPKLQSTKRPMKNNNLRKIWGEVLRDVSSHRSPILFINMEDD